MTNGGHLIIYSLLEKHANSIKDFDRAIVLDPKNANAYKCRGLAESKLNDSSGAIKDYDKAIELNPKYAEAYYYRALAYYELDNKKASLLSDFIKAKELGDKESDPMILKIQAEK